MSVESGVKSTWSLCKKTILLLLEALKAKEGLLREHDGCECHSAISDQEHAPLRANHAFSWQPGHVSVLDLIRD